MSSYLLLLAVVPIVVGVVLVNFLEDSTLEKQILPTYSTVTLGAYDTEIILKKTNAIISENEELQNRVTLIQTESAFQTSKLGAQISMLQDRMKAVEASKTSSIILATQLEKEVVKLETQIESLKSSSSFGSELLAAEKVELQSQLDAKQLELADLYVVYTEEQERSEREQEDFKLQLLQKQEEIDRIAKLSDSELLAEKVKLQSQLDDKQLEFTELYETILLDQERALAEKVELEEQLALQQAKIELLSESGAVDQENLDKIIELEFLITALEESRDDSNLGFDLLEKIASLESQIIDLEARNQTGSIFDQLSGFTHEIPTVVQPKIPTITMTEQTVTWDFVDSKNNKYQFSKLTDDFINEVIRLPPSQDTIVITLSGVGPGGSSLTTEVRDLSKFVVGSMPSTMNELRSNVPTRPLA